MGRLQYMFVIILSAMLTACTFHTPEKQMRDLALGYEKREISNYQMLLAMGGVYMAHPENSYVKTEYMNRMIISGYSSWVLHHFLSAPERVCDAEDEKILLFALKNGRHYDFAPGLIHMIQGDLAARLHEIITLGDSLHFYNERIRNSADAGAYAGRAQFFSTLQETELAGSDLKRSFDIDPCSPDALFQKCQTLFDLENTHQILGLFDRCMNKPPGPDSPTWMQVFYQLALDVEALNRSQKSDEEKLFMLANLYVNNGFADIALKKTTKLTELHTANPDYLALHAFVYYRKGNKRLAMRYLNDAETITGRTSRLRELIEKME